MASPALSRRVGKAVAYPPLCDASEDQRRELHEALLEATRSRTCPKWQAAAVEAEGNRPKLHSVDAK